MDNIDLDTNEITYVTYNIEGIAVEVINQANGNSRTGKNVFGEESSSSNKTTQGVKRKFNYPSSTSIESAGSNFDDIATKKTKEKENYRKQRGKGLIWEKVEDFGSEDNFKNSTLLKNLQSNFNNHRTSNTQKNGIVKEFVCKYSSHKKGYNCEAKMKTIVKNGSVEVFTNDKDHVHEKIGERKKRQRQRIRHSSRIGLFDQILLVVFSW